MQMESYKTKSGKVTFEKLALESETSIATG